MRLLDSKITSEVSERLNTGPFFHAVDGDERPLMDRMGRKRCFIAVEERDPGLFAFYLDVGSLAQVTLAKSSMRPVQTKAPA